MRGVGTFVPPAGCFSYTGTLAPLQLFWQQAALRLKIPQARLALLDPQLYLTITFTKDPPHSTPIRARCMLKIVLGVWPRLLPKTFVFRTERLQQPNTNSWQGALRLQAFLAVVLASTQLAFPVLELPGHISSKWMPSAFPQIRRCHAQSTFGGNGGVGPESCNLRHFHQCWVLCKGVVLASPLFFKLWTLGQSSLLFLRTLYGACANGVANSSW